jgi:site-specific DNA-methyltransferase (adenine-specific)
MIEPEKPYLEHKKIIRLEHKLINDHFQNFKCYGIPRAQLVIADIPYNTGKNAYGSSPSWYIGGDNTNGESKLANKEFFDTDRDFRISEFFSFCSKLLIKEPKETGKAPAMIVFCAFDQQFKLIEKAKEFGFKNYINLVFVKNFSPQVLKANMRIVGNCEYGIILFRDKLPKFNNNNKMIFNSMTWDKDTKSPKIHPTQKPLNLIKKLISIFTDVGDVVIDPVAGSGSTIVACVQLDRNGYGFEIKKDFYKEASRWIDLEKQQLKLELV